MNRPTPDNDFDDLLNIDHILRIYSINYGFVSPTYTHSSDSHLLAYFKVMVEEKKRVAPYLIESLNQKWSRWINLARVGLNVNVTLSGFDIHIRAYSVGNNRLNTI